MPEAFLFTQTAIHFPDIPGYQKRSIPKTGAPCLVFSTISSLTVSAESLGQMVVAAVSTIVVTVTIVFIALKLMRVSIRGFWPPLVFGNIGNMGLPICYFSFGDEGLALAIVVFAVYAPSMMTIGLWAYSGEKNPLLLLKSPIICAIAFALIFLILGQKPPEMVLKTTRLLGQFTIPLMLFTLGISLGSLTIDSMLRAFFFLLV